MSVLEQIAGGEKGLQGLMNSEEYQMTFRDWLAQIHVRLISRMSLIAFLPLISILVWNLWHGEAYWEEEMVIAVVVALVCLVFGAMEALRIGHQMIEVGMTADAFAARGEMRAFTSVEGRDELAWTAYSFKRMFKRIGRIASDAERAAAGDLTVHIVEKSEADILAKGLNQMIGNLRFLIGQIVDSTMIFTGAASQLSAVAETSSAASAQVSAAIQQIARGAEHQTQSVTQAARAEKQLSRTIADVAQGAQTQATVITQASETTQRLYALINEVKAHVEYAKKVQANAKQLAMKVREVEKQSQTIKEIARTMDDLTAQANMLALNAAIEARQGTADNKGFGVVVNEIRQFAQRSRVATKEIGRQATQVLRSTEEAVIAMETNVVEVDEYITGVVEAMREMETLVQELHEVIEMTFSVVTSHTKAAEEMKASSEQVSHEIKQVAVVSKENMVAVEEIKAAIEEMSAQMTEVVTSAQSLTDMAYALQNAVKQFKLSSDGEVGEGPVAQAIARDEQHVQGDEVAASK